jgi:SAM-dependent methyltransferase
VSDTDVNERDFWDRRADAWERRADALNVLSDAYGMPVMDALHLEAGERVLDIGCGPGTTAIELATRVGPDGEVVGADISPAMIAAATRRAAAAGASNARFVVANAQSDDLGADFDAAYSRFGVMFFIDPQKAFANIGRSLHPGGRLGWAVWGPLMDNPWMLVPTMAAGPVLKAELTIPGPNEPGPFSLADPERVTTLLSGAGFTDIAVEPVSGARVFSAATVDDDVQTLLEVGPMGEPFEAADAATRRAAVDAVFAALDSYRDGNEWRLPGAALKVTARRP